MISLALIQAIRNQYRLSWNGLHGPNHWARVLENGLRLAEKTGANKNVIELFAVFHDACRVNDDWDTGHGSRGADLAALFRGKYFDLNEAEFTALKFACRLHTDGLTTGDITVITCWDADRLDLGRVGVKPYKDLLCTNAAKEFEIFEWANDRACNGFVPEFVKANWMNFAD
jgi:uncharacterized protein